jgi:hypothetical protein
LATDIALWSLDTGAPDVALGALYSNAIVTLIALGSDGPLKTLRATRQTLTALRTLRAHAQRPLEALHAVIADVALGALYSGPLVALEALRTL